MMCDYRVGGFEDSALVCTVTGPHHTHVFQGETVDDKHTASEGRDD